MSGFRPLDIIYITGALASILGFLWTLQVIGLPPWDGAQTTSPQSEVSLSETALELSGTDLSGDIQKALIQMGKLEGVRGSSRDPVIKAAIRQAEEDFGLPADGIPDETLLRRLITELEDKALSNKTNASETGREEGGSSRWTLDDGIKVTQIMTPVSGILLAWFGLFRSNRKKATKLA